VEVCQHSSDGFEFVAGQNKKIGFAGSGGKTAVFLEHIFECPRRCRADGDQAAARVPRGIQPGGGFFAQFESFRFEDMFAGIVGANGNESSDADMQRQLHDFNSARGKLSEHFGREVKARGRRSDCAGRIGEDGLVFDRVRGGVVALYIRWERNVAVLFEKRIQGDKGCDPLSPEL